MGVKKNESVRTRRNEADVETLRPGGGVNVHEEKEECVATKLVSFISFRFRVSKVTRLDSQASGDDRAYGTSMSSRRTHVRGTHHSFGWKNDI